MERMPLKLSPAPKDYLWGGNRLKEEYGKKFDVEPLAETWECSTHPDGPSVIVGGAYDGRTLAHFLKEHPEALGARSLELTGGKAELPILVKLIDAAKDLSVQVHPDDDYALKYENSLGKTEMWYVLQATPDAKLVHGFRRDVTEEEVRAAAEDGSIEELLNYVPIRPGDLFYIASGTVHAIGAGALVAEVQESSNITYRLYDYNRVGADGKKRPLHVEQALRVMNRSGAKPVGAEDGSMERVVRRQEGCESELLKSCRYFTVERCKVWRETHLTKIDDSFRVLLFIDGRGQLDAGGESLPVCKGDTVFLPAGGPDAVISGETEYLDIRV